LLPLLRIWFDSRLQSCLHRHSLGDAAEPGIIKSGEIDRSLSGRGMFVDRVLLIGAPRGVSRSIALREAADAGHLDRLRIPSPPLDVLAQVLLAMRRSR
jgi:hypothetical protein